LRIVRRLFEKPATGFVELWSAKPETAETHFLSCPSSLCFDAIAPERKAKAEGRGKKVRADVDKRMHDAPNYQAHIRPADADDIPGFQCKIGPCKGRLITKFRSLQDPLSRPKTSRPPPPVSRHSPAA
jgi:hypothetical protein